MRFLIDAQLPPALARHLMHLGYEAVHVRDIGLLAARDQEIWEYAAATDAVLLTKDEDFVTMRALSSAAGPQVIWVRVGNTTLTGGKRRPVFGALQGKLNIPDAFFFEPLPDDELRLWEVGHENPSR